MAHFGYGISISAGETEFAEVVNIPFPTVESDEIESTNLQSPDGFREWIKGWKDGGEIEITLRFSEAEYGRILGLGDENQEFAITFPSGSVLEFGGFIKRVGAAKQLSDGMEMTVVIRTSGPVDFDVAEEEPEG